MLPCAVGAQDDLDSAYFLISAKTLDPDYQNAFLKGVGSDLADVLSPRDSLSDTHAMSIRRAGGTIFSTKALTRCRELLARSETCPWFLGFKVYATAAPVLEGDTLRIPFRAWFFIEKDDCKPGLGGELAGEFVLRVERMGGYRFLHETVTARSDIANLDAWRPGGCYSRFLQGDQPTRADGP